VEDPYLLCHMVLTGLNETEYRIQGRYTLSSDYDPLDDPERFRWSKWSNQVAFERGFNLLPVQGLCCYLNLMKIFFAGIFYLYYFISF